MTMRLYHPGLDRTHDIPDDEGLAAVLAESGWCKTIPPEHTDPALAAQQPDAVYQLVTPEPEAKSRGKRTAKPDGAGSADTD